MGDSEASPSKRVRAGISVGVVEETSSTRTRKFVHAHDRRTTTIVNMVVILARALEILYATLPLLLLPVYMTASVLMVLRRLRC